MNIVLHEGVISVNGIEISPLMCSDTVITGDNVYLNETLSAIQTSIESIKVLLTQGSYYTILSSDWIQESNDMYKVKLCDLDNDYTNFGYFAASPKSHFILSAIPKFRSLSIKVTENEVYLYCNCPINSDIEGCLYIYSVYNDDSAYTLISPNVDVSLEEDDFNKSSEGDYYTTTFYLDLLSSDYNISCTFNYANALQFANSGSRYITATYENKMVTIKSEFPFSGTVTLMITKLPEEESEE